MTIEKCDLCGSKNYIDPVRMNQFLQTKQEYKLMQCDECGLLVRKSLPDLLDEEKNKVCQDKGLMWSEYTAGTNSINRRMIERLLFFNKLLKNQPKRLLDIGCGSGSFIEYANENGWEAFGTDITDRVPKTGVLGKSTIFHMDITKGGCNELQKGSFSLVHLNHVIEHCSSPTILLKAATEYLSSDGMLCVEVPNEMFSLAAKIKMIFGVKYNSATAYFGHKYFFSKTTFERLLYNCTDLKKNSLKTPFIGYELSPLHKIFDYLQSSIGYGAVLEYILKKRDDFETKN